jgi:hypothetical protein
MTIEIRELSRAIVFASAQLHNQKFRTILMK